MTPFSSMRLMRVQHGELRESDLRAEFIQAHARIALQALEDGDVEAVQFHAGSIDERRRIFFGDGFWTDLQKTFLRQSRKNG